VEQTLFGNPRAIWGGEFVANFPVDDAVAGQLLKSARRERMLGSSPWMLDIVLAPGFSSKAVETLGKRAERKLMANEALAAPALRPARWMYRPVRGGFLRQPPNHYVLDLAQAELAGEPAGETAVDSLIIAWAVAWNSNHGGNETALACDRHLAAAGGGPSTADAVEVAIMRARSGGHELSGSAFAANAFFPFTDGPELLVKAGVKAGVVPAGGKQEPMVRRFFADHRVSVYYLPPEYRGFSRH
jgi:phosphoribosylaminoimidazolecarboxamide formyltransferase/IMP cyclohydrolase